MYTAKQECDFVWSWLHLQAPMHEHLAGVGVDDGLIERVMI